MVVTPPYDKSPRDDNRTTKIAAKVDPSRAHPHYKLKPPIQMSDTAQVTTSRPTSSDRPLKKVDIYTDGACQGNPGPGGWAAILAYGDQKREISGGTACATNNQMEILAAVRALEALKSPCEVTIYTDSAYLQNGASRWLENWKKRQWLTKGNQKVRNQDLWQELDHASSMHQVRWIRVKGHSNHRENCRCDFLAKAEISKLKQANNS
jgi:ribonuclease HI